MTRTTFINLPTSDLERTTAFFTALGFTFDPNVHSDETRRMVISDAASVMWHTETYFSQFTGGAVADSATKEVALGLSAAERDEVDDLTEKAVAAGGTAVGAQDLGYMYMRAFRDLDGHQWSLIHMAESNM
jgi:predicted lactoylglutathione lyase